MGGVFAVDYLHLLEGWLRLDVVVAALLFVFGEVAFVEQLELLLKIGVAVEENV